MTSPLLLGAGALAAGAAGVGAEYGARVNGSFEATRYVWSRGLGLLCHHNGGVAFVKGQRGGRPAMRFDPALFDRVREGDLVRMRLIALPQFIDEALPRIKAHFAPVTGDEDWAIPSGFDRSGELLGDARVAAWFTRTTIGP